MALEAEEKPAEYKKPRRMSFKRKVVNRGKSYKYQGRLCDFPRVVSIEQ